MHARTGIGVLTLLSVLALSTACGERPRGDRPGDAAGTHASGSPGSAEPAPSGASDAGDVPSADVPAPDVTGRYSVVSESEWALELNLEPDGRARIEISLWAPGEYEGRAKQTVDATWAQAGDRVTLSYGGVTDSLRYDAALSTQDFGREGALPGLEPLGDPDPRSMIGRWRLWRAEALRAIESGSLVPDRGTGTPSPVGDAVHRSTLSDGRARGDRVLRADLVAMGDVGTTAENDGRPAVEPTGPTERP